ncbi:SDR family NAD(P)-dependent oxidoreductase [Mucilaginibacter agri]|uniref:SDR family oxidoreductase n=1 Tax=Mucilaginibacter agri TaxID=2695265 RepID=A0A965ZFQ2_9SPHI|nr:SDR family oxidoreductase [Mucilaginibacter agri]NCD68826.1 SDR family oxidoreductase [Mucilaginibacter agri]
MDSLKNKVAVVFAASGEISGAVARSFAKHGAKVYLSARNLEAVENLAQVINSNGGHSEAALVDALNETEVDQYLQKIVDNNGRLDAVFNGIGLSICAAAAGIPTIDVPFEQFLQPMQTITGSQFLTSRLAAKYMIQSGSEGTILTLSAALSRTKLPCMSGITAACAAIEGITRVMAAEFGKQGVKVICLNSAALIETKKMKEVKGNFAKKMGIPQDQMEAFYTRNDLLKSGPTLQQVGEVAAFLVSDNGVTFNSHVVDVDCGKQDVI